MPNKGDLILIGTKKVGEVTSGSHSPTRGRGTAMGYVKPEHTIPGLVFAIECEGKRHDAKLSVMPLYDPGDSRTRVMAQSLGYCARGVSDAFVRAGCEGKKIVRHCRGSVRLKFWADSKRDSEGRSLDQHNLCLPSSPNSHCVECATDPTGLNVAR